jgi:hypothetical protein
MAALPPGHCQEMPLETARHASPTSSQNATVVLETWTDGGCHRRPRADAFDPSVIQSFAHPVVSEFFKFLAV